MYHHIYNTLTLYRWTGSSVLILLAHHTFKYKTDNFIKLFMPKNVDIQLAIFIYANSRLYFCRHTLWDFISPCICHIFFKFIAQPIDSTSLFLYENTAHYNCYATKYRIWKLNVDCLWMLYRYCEINCVLFNVDIKLKAIDSLT